MFNEFRITNPQDVSTIGVICLVNYWVSSHNGKLYDCSKTIGTIGYDLKHLNMPGVSFFGMKLPTWEERAK